MTVKELITILQQIEHQQAKVLLGIPKNPGSFFYKTEFAVQEGTKEVKLY